MIYVYLAWNDWLSGSLLNLVVNVQGFICCKPLASINVTLEKEQQRKIRIQARAQETLRASSAPTQHLSTRFEHQARSSQRTKNKVLGFLEQSPSFRPKTNAKVPDFDKLHQTFQKEAMERTERRGVTLCQPFQLRTSTLQPRQSRSGTVKSPVGLVFLLFSIQVLISYFNVYVYLLCLIVILNI